MKGRTPLHTSPAAYDTWLRILIVLVLASTAIPAAVLAASEPEGAGVLLAATLFTALVLHGVLPRRFEVYEDRVRLVLGWPFAFNVPFATITEVRPASGTSAFVYWGLRLATSRRSVVEIDRRHGLSMVISPRNGDAFLEQVKAAMERWTSTQVPRHIPDWP